MQVINIKDFEHPVPTSNFQYAKFPFEYFNPVQSAVVEISKQDVNCVVAARTGAGKTAIAEMFMSYELNQRGGKVIFLAPLRALAKEKTDDWMDENYIFSGKKVAICTGDYQLTESRLKELRESDIIVMTPEMLASRCRNINSEKSEFLREVGTIVADEVHLLCVPGRGDHLEVAMMKLPDIARNLRLVFLSATMPNVDEIAGWCAHKLTKKDTYLLLSQYRPCPLDVHYETYDPAGKYEEVEREKVRQAMMLYNRNPEDKHLIFCHTKRTGKLMLNALKAAGITAEFHSGDLEKHKRHEIERKFKNRQLDVLVATSTVAWGSNLPARRVIILGVHRGIDLVDTWDIWQMVGRAGRPGYDPRGDAYVLIPENMQRRHINRLNNPQRIESRLLEHTGDGEKARYKTLAFHIISEIHHGNIKTADDIHKWYEKSLAHHQKRLLDDDVVDLTIRLLIKYGAIKEEDGVLKPTAIGMLASMFYFSPFDISDLRRNFGTIFQANAQENDFAVSMALGATDMHRSSIVSKPEREDMLSYKMRIERIFGRSRFTDGEIKGGFIYYSLMNGMHPVSILPQQRQVQADFGRVEQVLRAVDNMACKWDKKDFFNTLRDRVRYGVKPHLVGLCAIPEVGAKRAEILYHAGFKGPKDIVANWDKASSLLKLNETKMGNIKSGCFALINSDG